MNSMRSKRPFGRATRLLGLIVAVLLAGSSVGWSGSARAADACYKLTVADCALLHESEKPEAIRKLSAFAVSYTLVAKLSGVGQESTFDLSAKGNGGAQLDADALTSLGRGELGTALGKTSAFGLTTDATLTAPALSQAGMLEVRVLNETLYLKSDLITGGKWQSADAKTLSQRDGAVYGALAGLVRGGRVLILFNRIHLTFPNHVKAERMADLDIDGQKVAAFKFTVDLPKVLAAPELKPLLTNALSLIGDTGKPSDLDETLALVGALSGKLQVNVIHYVGTTDRLFHGFGLEITGPLDSSVIQPLSGGGSPGGSDTRPLNLYVRFGVQVSKIGVPPTIIAPPDSTPFDPGTISP